MMGDLPDLVHDQVDQTVLRIKVEFVNDAVDGTRQAVMNEMQRAQADAKKEDSFN